MKTKQLVFTLSLGLALTLATLGALTLPGVLAADIIVNPAANDGDPGSLRAAISTANSNGEDNTITLTGADQTIINANGIDWALHIHTGTVVISGVYPAANTHTAPLSVTLSIALSGSIQQSSVTTQTVVVHGGMRGQMDGDISFASILYDPTQNFFPGELEQTSVTTGVLDSDGAPILPYVWQFRAAAGVGPATFGDSGANLGSSFSYDVDLGDVDGDGDLDAFVGNYGQANHVWLNDGAGNYNDSGASLGSSFSYAVALGDLDGDGDLDAFVGNHARANKVWLNDGAGNYNDSGASLGDSNSFAVALGDVDGDGDLDAFVGNYRQANKVWLNDGAGNFSDSGVSLGSSDSFAVALRDVDGDGDLDAFVVNYNFQSYEVWLNDGTGNFGDSGTWIWGPNSVAVDLGDVDGDGDLDAFVGNYGQANHVWLNDGAGNFSNSGAGLGNFKSFAVALGDVDGDGDLDGFVGNDGQANKVWLNDGAGNFSDSGASLGSSDSYAVALGDVDGDGDLDGFVGNDGQANKVWLNQPSEIDVQGNGQSIPNGSTIPSTANHTDFGKTDVSGGAVVRTFSISSSGAADLALTGSPAVTLTTGTHFSITTQPSSPVISITTFNVTFDPSAEGSFTDTVHIANNDVDENPYTFVISGTGAITMPTYILTVSISGNGRVDLDPPGTQVTGTLDLNRVYAAGTVVTMTASADTGWRFDGWSGDASGTAVFPLLMDSSKAVTAAFGTDRVYLPLVLK